jgi:uncharacterized membrane protein
MSVHLLTGGTEDLALPRIRKIGFADLRVAIERGLDDFLAQPTHVIFLAIVYPLAGLFLARLAFGYKILPLLFPLASGFALVGPFLALGLYEMSRQRERGVAVTWRDALGVFRCPSLDAILALGLILVVLFLVWIAVAQSLYQALFGYAPPESLSGFLTDIVTTRNGRILILAGNAIGLAFALAAFLISVVSFPMLLDREVGVVVAVSTSVMAVVKNPVVMLAWGLVVAVSLAVASLPAFIGLAVVVPVLAHATWHLYRRVVE